ncbi:MAG: amidohydrolase, partial [SAR202 cluster bacterium]|nr:amidohydrolase [SAR202 cluster bacterium]
MTNSTSPADLIFHNGQILTMDSSSSIQSAVAVKGNAIQAVGADNDILPLAGLETKVTDLRGRTLIPGIVDIHAHMDREGLKEIFPTLADSRSITDILEVIREQVSTTSPGEWVVTMPIGDPPNYTDMPQSLAEGRYPTRWELDQVSPDNPVYIRGIWTPWNVPPSISIANSAAFKLAGIDRHTQSPDSTVTIEKNSDGEPTGIFIDQNTYPTVEFNLMRVVPRFTHTQRVAALKRSMALYNSVGTTSTYEGHGVAPEVVRAYREVWDSGAATVRSQLVLNPVWESAEEAQQDMEQWGHTASGSGFGDEMLKLTGIYLQYEGSQYIAESRLAELPFTGWAGFGQAYNDADRFRKFGHLAARHNLRVNTLVRDVLEEVLTIFEEVHQETPIDQKRWVINHVLQASPEQLQRIKNLGLVVETIPLTELWLRGSKYLDQPDLADSAVPHRRYDEMGVHYAFGTDNKPYNPFATLWAAVARTERQTGKVLGPDQRLSRMDALRVFTMGGAYFCFEEDRRGSIEPEKLADMAVLSDDILTMQEA